MIFRRTAPRGAIARLPCATNRDAAVRFQAQGRIGSAPGDPGPGKAWLSRIGGALWVGTWLATSAIGGALAPAAAEPADAPHASPRLPGDEPARPELDPTLTVGGQRIARALVETVIRAAEATEVDPVYMLALADKESNFLAEAKAGTSSAEGLFQFVNSTWLEMIRSHGAKYGYETAAAAVETVRGELTIANDVMREWVLGLRRDAYLSAVMAGEMLKRDRAKVARRIGRDLSRSEYYLVHFLGAASAGKLMAIVNGKPKQSAPAAFPQAAKANKTLFFARNGGRTRHLTVGEVYDRLDRMIDARLDRYIGVSGLPAMMRTSL